MKVSVIIPTHKVHPYLDDAIASALAQTHRDIEIIVVNDGGGSAVVDHVKSIYPSVHVLDLPQNVGAGLARNAGVAEAAGTLIAFLDSDDLWVESKIERQVAFLSDNPDTKCLHCGLTTFGSNGDFATHLDKPALLKKQDVLFRGHVLPSSMIIYKDIYDAVGGFNDALRTAEDYDLILRLVQSDVTIRFLGESLVKFRRMDQGNLSSNWKGILSGKIALYREHRNFFRAVGGRAHFFNYFSGLFSECASKASRPWRFILIPLSKVFHFCAKLCS